MLKFILKTKVPTWYGSSASVASSHNTTPYDQTSDFET